MKYKDSAVIFSDRFKAGRELAVKLIRYKKENPIVLALARGGVAVGFEVAKKLETRLEVFIVRKIGSPYNSEFGVGAVAEVGGVFLDNETISHLKISQHTLSEIIESEEKEIERRVKLYRNGKSLVDLEGKTVIVVDDGLATGVTARATIEAINSLNPKKIIFATPICAYDSISEITTEVEAVVCIIDSFYVGSIGAYYDDFTQVTDKQVVDLLKLAKNNSIKNLLTV